MARVRLFVAIELAEELRRAARRIVNKLAAQEPVVKWVAPHQLHLTLKFVGDVEDREIYSVCRAVGEAAAGSAPFTVACAGIGAFPDRQRPRTIWLGVGDPDGQVARLQSAVEFGLAKLGVPREFRAYHPHITLGRVGQDLRQLETLQQALVELADQEAGWLPVNQCTVFRSELLPRGPVYTCLGRLPLGEQP